MTTNVTDNEIKQEMIELARLELNQTISREKQLELVKLHRILVERRLKKTVADLSIRKRLLGYYDILITEQNIEKYYNLKIQTFLELFYDAKIEIT